MPIGMKECPECKGSGCEVCLGTGYVGTRYKHGNRSRKGLNAKSAEEAKDAEGDDKSLRMDGGTDKKHPVRAIIVMVSGSAEDIGSVVRELTRG